MRYMQDIIVSGDLNTNRNIAADVQRSGVYIEVFLIDGGIHILVHANDESIFPDLVDELVNAGAVIISAGPVTVVEP